MTTVPPTFHHPKVEVTLRLTDAPLVNAGDGPFQPFTAIVTDFPDRCGVKVTGQKASGWQGRSAVFRFRGYPARQPCPPWLRTLIEQACFQLGVVRPRRGGVVVKFLLDLDLEPTEGEPFTLEQVREHIATYVFDTHTIFELSLCPDDPFHERGGPYRTYMVTRVDVQTVP